MALIFPNKPVGITTPETMRIYQLLRRLPDKGYSVWHRLSIWEDLGPDFWLLRQDRMALLLKVSSATPEYVRSMLQPDLFDPKEDRPPVGRIEGEILLQFQEDLCHSVVKNIPRVVCFPNLTAKNLESVSNKLSSDLAFYLSKEYLVPDRFGKWLDDNLSQKTF